MKLLTFAVLCASAAFAQEAPAKHAPEIATLAEARAIEGAAQDKAKALAKAEADAKRANERRDRAVREAAEAAAALNKAQGRSEPTNAEALELVTLQRDYQALQRGYEVELQQQVAATKQAAERAANAYNAALARIRTAHNAEDCKGVDGASKWTACAALPAVSEKK